MKIILLFKLFSLVISLKDYINFNDLCKIDEKIKNPEKDKLHIFTINDQSNLQKELSQSILENCKFSNEWNMDRSSTFYEDSHNIYEKESINRRTFRIKLKKKEDSGENDNLIINKIDLIKERDFSKDFSPVLTTVKLPFSLSQGNSLDFFIDYNCLVDWIKIKVRIEINDSFYLEFSYIKICSQNANQFLNPTYILLVIIFIIISYLCEKDYLILNVNIVHINPEEIIALKYAEHITVYTMIIFAILVLLSILTIFKHFSYAAGFIISLISIKFFFKSSVALYYPNFEKKVSNKKWVINEKNGLVLSLSKILYYSVALVILSAWLIYFNTFISNLISFSISYLLIKKIYFKNFYFIFFLFMLVILYNLIWIFFNSVSYGHMFNFSSTNSINIPIRFIIPEIIASPYCIKYFFSIVDLVLIGYLIEYLKRTKLSNNYLIYGRYALYFGLFINTFLFYFFKLFIPFFVFPGISMIISIISFSVWKQEFKEFVHINKQEIYLKNKIKSEFPLIIIGADQSLDYQEMLQNTKYIPPEIINEIYEISDQSHRDQDVVQKLRASYQSLLSNNSR